MWQELVKVLANDIGAEGPLPPSSTIAKEYGPDAVAVRVVNGWGSL